MIDGNAHEFVDMISRGCGELWITYKGKEYQIQEWQRRCDGLYAIVIDADDLPDDQIHYWEHIDDNLEKCGEAFLAAPIWDGKTFWEVESEMTWID